MVKITGRRIVIAAGAIVVAAGITTGALMATAGPGAPQPTKTPDLSVVASPTPDPTVTTPPSAAPIVEPVAPAPAPVYDPPPPPPTYGNYPGGWTVPFVASSDPEDAAGGYYDTNACASNSASTVGGVPKCD